MATEQPPSYDSVVSKIDADVKSDPSVQGLKNVFENLSQAEKDVLVAQADTSTVILNKDQEQKFRKGFAEGFAQALPHLEVNAEQCAILCKKVTKDFLDLAHKFSSISAQDGSQDSKNLLSEFKTYQDRYQELIEASRTSAVKVALQADKFDSVVVPVAASPTIPIDVKRKKIASFIEEAEKLEKEAGDISGQFKDFVKNIGDYTGRFSGWARTKEGELSNELKNLNDKIKELESSINKVNTAMLAIGGVAGVALPALVVGAACAGPFAPFVLGFAILAAAGTVASITALAFQLKALNNERDSKIAQRNAVSKQQKEIQQSRVEIIALGETLKTDVTASVDIINATWNHCKDDATKIKGWLEEGQGDLGILPDYVAVSLGKADGIYSVIGKYLTKYAECLADTSK